MTKARDLANVISGSGVLAGGVIPDLPASKITSGTIDNARITLDAAEIPSLAASKITSGTLSVPVNTSALTVDTNTLHVDASNNRIGVNRTDPDAGIDATGTDNRMLRLISTEGSSGVSGPYITLFRDNVGIGSGDRIGALYFLGVPSGVQTQSTFAAIEATIISHHTQDGQLEFKIEKSASPRRALTLNNTEAVFNEDAQNIDFRIESQNDNDLFKVDASADQVSIADMNLTAGNIKTNSSELSIDVDADGTYTNANGTYFVVKSAGTGIFAVEDDDAYVKDNFNAGRLHDGGNGNLTYMTTHSHISAFSAELADGTGEIHRTYIQSYGSSSDPELAVFQAHTRDVRDMTGESTPTMNQKTSAHMLDQSGRSWHWGTAYYGRMRPGDTTSTNAYRAADIGVYAYSNSGGTQGGTGYQGYTAIIGRDAPNGDDCFRVHIDGSDRIELDANGNGYFDGGADMGAADYAEYFEWADGNPDKQDRRGYPVILETGGKMRIATDKDNASDIIGIVSVEAAMVGDSAWAHWAGMYERDKFGQQVYEDYELLCWGEYDEQSKSYKTQTTRQAMIDAGREKDIPEDAKTIVKQRKKKSADYDPSKTYIPRKDRPEWQAIGLMGKLPLLKGQPTAPQWKKLFDLNSEVEMWLVR